MPSFEIENADLALLVKTAEDRQVLTWLIEDIANQMYTKEFNLQEYIQRYLPYDMYQQVTVLFQKCSVSQTDAAQVANFFKTLSKHLSLIPTIQITLAITPTKYIVETICAWFFHTYQKVVIISITIDKDLIGGAVIGSNGKQYEYTLKKALLPNQPTTI